jgi:hypothetical protein
MDGIDGVLNEHRSNHHIGCEVVNCPSNGDERNEVNNTSTSVTDEPSQETARIAEGVGDDSPNLLAKHFHAVIQFFGFERFDLRTTV